jgi:LysR family transcriptional regulator, transcriptional activator of nhaA
VYTLNYQHLKYFWAVSRHGNLTRASAELLLTPQTVSTQIRDLEKGLGVELFSREGRRLVLTDIGRVVYRYADEIFNIGREIQDVVRGLPGRAMYLVVGVADVVPKLIAHQLIEPATQLKEPVRVICREGRTDRLLAELAIHKLDVVLSDTPIPPAVKIRAYNHLLGESKVTFMASDRLARNCRKGFPESMNGAPILLPAEGTVLRGTLEQWFDSLEIRPMIVGEFEDSALLKAFGQAGVGIFAVPSVIQDEVGRQYGVEPIGVVEGIVERFYAISLERKVRHPAVAAVCIAAKSVLFA